MNALLQRLQHHVALVETDYSAMLRLAHRIVVKQPGQALVTAGERLADVFFLEEGWAIRYRILDDGRRQIVNFMTPGDCFDLQALLSANADHYVSALTAVRIRVIQGAQFYCRDQRERQPGDGVLVGGGAGRIHSARTHRAHRPAPGAATLRASVRRVAPAPAHGGAFCGR